MWFCWGQKGAVITKREAWVGNLIRLKVPPSPLVWYLILWNWIRFFSHSDGVFKIYTWYEPSTFLIFFYLISSISVRSCVVFILIFLHCLCSVRGNTWILFSRWSLSAHRESPIRATAYFRGRKTLCSPKEAFSRNIVAVL